MAMSHETCEHPRTPAGRAWCRSNGGPGSGAVWGSLADNEPTMKAARAGKSTPASPKLQAEIMDRMGLGTRPAKVINAEKLGPGLPKTRRVAPKVNVTDMPRVFRTAVDWATSNGMVWEAVGDNNNSVIVKITNPDTGVLHLTYSHATPNGVHAVSFRPNGTSITRRVTSVNDGLAKLKG